MARLSLTLLGSFQIELNERLITEFESDRVRSLLAYLVVEADRPHARGILATLLWPDQPEERARTNLRHVLYELRNMLANGEQNGEQDRDSADFLLSTRQTLQFNSASSYSSDVKTFVGLMAECEAHAHTRLATCADCMPRLSQAILLYRGTFLLGLNLAGSAPFEEWVRMMQERLQRQVLQGLHALTTFAETHGDWSTALRYAYQQVELEPWREEAHQQLMRAQAHNGQRSAALAQFETLRQLLHTELGVAPSPESVAVYEQIRSNTLQPAHVDPPRKLAQPVAQWGDVPDVGMFYGRQTELLELRAWAVQNRSRVVSVLGLGGMGKTALVATFARAQHHAFDRVLWHSLVNAPPLDEMLRTTLQSLIDASTNSSDSASTAVRTSLPATLDGQLALLLDYLRRQRCLLVLDNLESLLQAETAGAFRPGYEDYGQLIQRVAEYEHQSCLLLTSREQPNVFLRLDDATPTPAQNPAVRTLHLNGLDDAAAGAMLSARGLAGQSSDGVMLAERYSRNPLALKLVSLTVQEMFGGDIAAYLTGETLIFDDIRTVLDQQFSRLTELERDIMIWLAIEREPTSFQTLRENVLQPLRVHTLVEALRSLQRRSLVGHSPSGFVLQNVVMEYTTGVLIERICSEIETGFNSKSAVEPLAFNRYALLKAQSREYVRASQARLILDPIATPLLASLGKDEIAVRVKAMTAALRAAPLHSQDALVAGYAAGNAINLLLHMDVDLRGSDFSNLCVWQAYMQGSFLADVNFSGSNLARSVFTYVFGKIEDIYFDTDRNLLVVGSMNGKLRLWRAVDGQLLHEYQSFGADVRFAVLSHDGRMLASGHIDHQIRIWDGVNGHLLQTLHGHSESLWGLAFSPNRQVLASGSGAGEVCLWDVKTGHLLHTFQNHSTGVPALAFTPDGRYLASGDVDGIVCVYRLDEKAHPSTHQPTLVHQFQAHTDEVHALVFDGTGTTLITSSHDRTIHVWDVSSGKKLRTLNAHTLPIRSLGISADGHTLASIGEDQFACLWDVRTGQLLHTFSAPIHHDPFLKFSQDGHRLAIVGAHPSVDLWDVATGQRLDSLQSYSNHVTSVAMHADANGMQLAGGGSDRMVRLWTLSPTFASDGDNSRLRNMRLLQGHKRAVLAVAFGSDAHTLASADEEPNIRLWDVDTGHVIRILDGHTNKVESIQFSRDGQQLVSASHDRTVRVWDIQNHHRSLVLRGHTDSVRTCAISPDSQWVASGSSDRTVRLWNLRAPLDAPSHTGAPGQAGAPGHISLVLSGHTNGVRGVAFSPDGHILVSVSYDQTLRVWDVQRGGRPMGIWPFQTIVLSAAFHPDGNLIATGTGDYRVSLWDVHTGQLRRELRGHSHRIEALCFSSDGRWLISGSFDETIRIWDVEAALAGEEALVSTLRAEGPYAGMNITRVTGIGSAQKAVLTALGAVEA